MIAMVMNVEGLLDHLGDARGCPQLRPVAIGHGPPQE